MLLIASAAFASWMWTRRVVKEDRVFLALGSSLALFLLILLFLANLSVASWPSAVVLLIAGIAIGKKAEFGTLKIPAFSIATRIWLLLMLFIVVVYTSLSLNLKPDDDFWIHFPLQGLLKSKGLPVLHPFFAEIQMNGHYGRDLLIATVAEQLNIGLLQSLYFQTMSLQLGSFALLVGLSRAASKHDLVTLLVVATTFFGINVGGRGGLLDCHQNNNALAYFLTLAILHLFLLVYEKQSLARILTGSFCLGVFAIVYETHFGLLGLVLGAGLLITRRKEFAFLGLAALLLACVQGGPITKVVKDRLNPVDRVWTPGELNQHQIIKLKFPKDELFQIKLALGLYQQRSFVYRFLPDLGSVSNPVNKARYRPIWSWDVLRIHWLVTLLAPWSLWMAWKRRSPLGLAACSFGLFSYLVPGLVNFGPIYEFEYFRWQFAAGFGFAIAFGLALGEYLSGKSKVKTAVIVSLLFVINILPTLLVFVPKAVLPGWRIQDCFLPRSESKWLLSQPSAIGGFNYSDLLASRFLREQSKPGDRLLVNSPHYKASNIRFSSTLSAVSGLRLVGHSLPWPQEPVGTPPFHRNAPATAFWLAPSRVLLDQLGVEWVYLRPGQEPTHKFKAWLDENGEQAWMHGDHVLYRYQPKDSFKSLLSDEPRESKLLVSGFPESLVTASPFEFQLEGEEGKVYAWAFVPEGGSADSVDLLEVVTWEGGPAIALSPPTTGDFRLLFFEKVDEQLVLLNTSEKLRVEERRELPI